MCGPRSGAGERQAGACRLSRFRPRAKRAPSWLTQSDKTIQSKARERNVAVPDSRPNTEIGLLLSRRLEPIFLEYVLRLRSRKKIQETLCLVCFFRTFQNSDRVNHRRMRIRWRSCDDSDLLCGHRIGGIDDAGIRVAGDDVR